MKTLLSLGLAVFVATAFGQEFRLGSAVTDFTLQDLEGRTVRFASLKGDLTVVMFIATQCPVSNAYNERMQALYADYASRGVKFVAINSNVTEPAAEVARHAAEHGFGFQVFKDPGNVVADRFGAQFTPEVFVVDRAGTIVYHGAIDDAQNPASVKTHSLRQALDELLVGRAVSRPETRAFGCTIKREKKTS